ncbi:hypothetical protein [Prevotella sp. kh1p2]|uniref:hypothetical protein n=1 Tax=Prevotella sp. kh1p2 TaxID=1761883 RepID=UPI0008C59E3D|nr:hypothetical protein [Prevotella sp. kh1p2]SES96182.1 hypothetical protein SAMN04487825_10981 [Prevotella sp. kh1p2]SNU11325.1 hypothetical protein SAMN06298210_10980 [Prevotellaceae bacterium KH2P17]
METPITPYKNLHEIRLRKALLLADIQKDDQKIRSLWSNLFHQPVAFKSASTPSRRFNSLMNTGAGVLDGVILAWKLYRKFKK